MLLSSRELHLISGGALGIDQFWIEVGLYLGIPVTAALPFKGYDDRWPSSSREKYRQLLDQCYDVRYICEPGYESRKLQIRNEWMVTHSDVLVAYWNGASGGTKNCIKFAHKMYHPVNIFNTDEIINSAITNAPADGLLKSSD
jgi:uncharacterized phage-like protein YoqJ